jgi:hypothetical protein
MKLTVGRGNQDFRVVIAIGHALQAGQATRSAENGSLIVLPGFNLFVQLVMTFRPANEA